MLIGGAIIIISTLMVTVYEKQLLSLFNRKDKIGLMEGDAENEVSKKLFKDKNIVHR